MARYIICGDEQFNNYYFVFYYLSRLLSQAKNLCLMNRGTPGADLLSEVYAHMENINFERYAVKDNTPYNRKMRDLDLVKKATNIIAFTNGDDPEINLLLQRCSRKGISPITIPYKETDIVKPHPTMVFNKHKQDKFDVYIGRGSEFGNPFEMSEKMKRMQVIAAYTHYILKDKQLLKKMLSLKGKTLGCYCAPQLCHGDMIVWMIENVYNEILQEINSSENTSKKPFARKEVDYKKYPILGGAVPLYTTSNFKVSEAYDEVVMNDDRTYFEIADKDILRDKLHVTMEDKELTEEDEPIKVVYTPNDNSGIKLFQQLVEFDNSPFKRNKWYINSYYIKE